MALREWTRKWEHTVTGNCSFLDGTHPVPSAAGARLDGRLWGGWAESLKGRVKVVSGSDHRTSNASTSRDGERAGALDGKMTGSSGVAATLCMAALSTNCHTLAHGRLGDETLVPFRLHRQVQGWIMAGNRAAPLRKIDERPSADDAGRAMAADVGARFVDTTRETDMMSATLASSGES